GGDGRHRAGEGAQRAVRLRVADQDAAEQRAVPPDDQLLVQAGPGVGVDDVEAVPAGAVCVAEGRDVHAEQLQLGGQVGAGERRRGGGDARGGGRRPLVAGGGQAVPPAVGGQRALADREHVRVGDRAALLVHRDAAALADVEAAVPGEPVAGADTGGEHHQVGGEFGPVGQLHAGDRTVRAD